ncbi:MAG: hypothetical protein AB7V50_09285 [Vampirovibrionia bacterium]
MFSDFVKFQNVLLLVDGKPYEVNKGLKAIDISHDNKIYQIILASSNENNETINFTEQLIEQINKGISVCVRIEYDLKNSLGKIDDLYRIIPEENKLLSVSKAQGQDTITIKGRLIARNNISFDYENINKAANY